MENDDWKGEHLIRSVPPHDNRLASRGAQLAGAKRGQETCEAPGCDAILDRRNVTGFCKLHRNHYRRDRPTHYLGR